LSEQWIQLRAKSDAKCKLNSTLSAFHSDFSE